MSSLFRVPTMQTIVVSTIMVTKQPMITYHPDDTAAGLYEEERNITGRKVIIPMTVIMREIRVAIASSRLIAFPVSIAGVRGPLSRFTRVLLAIWTSKGRSYEIPLRPKNNRIELRSDLAYQHALIII